MRTDKKFADVIPLTEWQGEVKEHYLDEEQNKRIDETIRFIYLHCSSNYANKYANFNGLWNYLDVDKKHLRSFKTQLKKLIKQNFVEGKVVFDAKDYELEVFWK